MEHRILFFAICSFALFFLFGCVQPNPPQKDEIQSLREFQMPSGWALKELPNESGSIAFFEIKNDGMLCKVLLMSGEVMENPSFEIKFAKKWAASDYENNEIALGKIPRMYGPKWPNCIC